MTDYARATIVIEYPLASAEAYHGETNPGKQAQLEQEYLNEDNDYLIALLTLDSTEVDVKQATVIRVQRD